MCTFGRMTGVFYVLRYCGNTEVRRIPNQESAQKVDTGEEISPAVSESDRTRGVPITRPALHH